MQHIREYDSINQIEWRFLSVGIQKSECFACIEMLYSGRGKKTNLTALKSNSNTVWFNFQTYIYEN
jgi:hypothetical protein